MTELWEGFDQYLAKRAPSESEKAEVRRYRERIHDILSAKYRVMAFYQSGSFQHGTAVRPYSDVDYIARINREDKPVSSNSILESMKVALKTSLWEASEVYVARPTVTLKFAGLVTDYGITPAYLERGSADADRVVLIPAAGGGWREAAPQAHNKFVADMDRKHHRGGSAARSLAKGLEV